MRNGDSQILVLGIVLVNCHREDLCMYVCTLAFNVLYV